MRLEDAGAAYRAAIEGLEVQQSSEALRLLFGGLINLAITQKRDDKQEGEKASIARAREVAMRVAERDPERGQAMLRMADAVSSPAK